MTGEFRRHINLVKFSGSGEDQFFSENLLTDLVFASLAKNGISCLNRPVISALFSLFDLEHRDCDEHPRPGCPNGAGRANEPGRFFFQSVCIFTPEPQTWIATLGLK
jgi:hypothetical protein